MRVVVMGVILLAASGARAQEEPLPPVPPPPGSQPAVQPQPVQPQPVQPQQLVQPQATQPVQPQATQPQVDPNRRSGWEMFELYLTGFGVGTLGTITAMIALDAEEAYYYALFPPLGGTVGIATVALLDRSARFPRGVPSAMSMWSLVGLGEGLLIWGALDDRPGATGVMSLLTLGSVSGLLVGAAVGYGLEPEPADNRLTLTGALWGGAIALFSALAFDWSAKPLNWRIALGGYGGGAVLGTLIGSVTDMSIKALGLLNGGIVTGGLIGLGIVGLIHEKKRDEGGANPEVTAAGLSIGMGSGLLLGIFLAAADAADHPNRVSEGPPPFRLGAAPVPGGAMISADITL